MSEFKERFKMFFEMGQKAASARSSSAVVAELFGGDTRTSDRDIVENQEKYIKRGWQFAASRPIAARLAERHLRVAMKSVAPAKKISRDSLPTWVKQQYTTDMDMVADHDILRVIEAPNPYYTGWHLKYATALSLQATGKAFWWFKEANEVWYCPASAMTPNYGEGGRRSGWTLKVGAGSEIDITEDRVAYFFYPDPGNPLEACGPLQAASRPVLSSDAIHEAQYTGFMGGQMPDHAFVLGEKVRPDGSKERPELQKTQYEELSNRFKTMFGGPRKRNNFILLDSMISDVKKLSMTPSEMDYLSSSKLVQDEIIKMIGTPLVSMGGVETATRASALVAEEVFGTNVLNPTLQMIGQVLTNFVRRSSLFQGSENLICYFDEIHPTDTQEELRKYQIAYDRGIIDDDDFRVHVLRMPPKANGAGKVARINAALATVPVGPAQTPVSLSMARREASPVSVKTRGAWARAFQDGEIAIKNAVQEVFIELQDEMVDSVQRGERDLLLVQESMFAAKLSQALRKSLIAAGRMGADNAVALSGSKSVSPAIFGGGRDAYLLQYVDEVANKPWWSLAISEIMDETRELIRAAGNDGFSTREITDYLIETIPDLTEYRAERIALTEATGAVNAGAHSTRLSMASMVAEVEWSAVLDMETRGTRADDRFNHVAMNGVRVPFGEDFDIGGESAPFPGHHSLSAANRINCRCITLTHLRIP